MSMCPSRKHAYLIMAHNNFDQLQTLVSLLDDARNDIYLHIDKKAKNFSRDCIKTQNADVFFVDPISVTWGGDSQIKCEMILFKYAASKHYMYYHLLSGMDLPLKTQDEIHQFFSDYFGKNFMELDQKAMATGSFLSRTQYYHLFQNIIGRKDSPRIRILRSLDRKFVNFQIKFGLKRKDMIPLFKGANWVSITDELVHYIISCEKIIKKQFYHSVCADEVFLQSIAMYSPYRDTIVPNYYRAIDWERGAPYTFRKEDIPQLLNSPNMFARKFDRNVDEEAIRLIVKHLSKDNQ